MHSRVGDKESESSATTATTATASEVVDDVQETSARSRRRVMTSSEILRSHAVASSRAGAVGVARGGSLIMLASSSAELRGRWGEVLNDDFVMCEVSELATLRRNLANLRPSVLLVDLALLRLSGSGAIREIARVSPSTRMIAFAATYDDREAVLALRAGARGYCQRDIDPMLLKKAVEVVQKGEVWARRSVLQQFLGSAPFDVPAVAHAVRGEGPGSRRILSRRQHQIADLIGSGADNRQIAGTLGISEKTVKTHLTAIFRKVGVPNRLRLALWLKDAPAVRTRPRSRAKA